MLQFRHASRVYAETLARCRELLGVPESVEQPHTRWSIEECGRAGGRCSAAATGVDGVSVARGAIGNPWIFREVRALAAGRPLPAPPSLLEQREVIAEHYRLAEEVYGPKRCCSIMRKHGIKYSRLHPQADEVRQAFVAVRSPDQWPEVLARWYAEDLPGRHPPGPERRRDPTA